VSFLPSSSARNQIDLAQQRSFQLGQLRVDPALCSVWSATLEKLEPRVMQVLVALVEASPQVVSRDTLIQRCWDGRIVGDDAINRVVGRLRKLAQVDGLEHFRIETSHKIGYRLLGTIEFADLNDKLDAGEPTAGPVARITNTASGIPAIAVLPFRHPEDDINQAYFAEGMAEEIIADLTLTPHLRVVSPLSSLNYRPGDRGARQVCSELGVQYLLQGQIRRMDDQLRLLVNLTDGRSDETIWSARFARPISDLFDVQAEVAAGIVGAIGPAIFSHEQLQPRTQKSGVDFWEVFIRARFHFWKGTIPDFDEAATLLDQALRLKPEDPVALSLLAMVDLSKLWSGRDPDPARLLQKADESARRAIAADNRCPVAHHVLGIVLAQQGEHDLAVAAQRRSLQLNPNNAQAIGELARLMAFGGDDVTEVLALADAALLLSPTDPHDWLWLRSKAIALFLAERRGEALEMARAACTRRPDYFFLHILVAACAAAADEPDTARKACDQARAMSPGYNVRGLKLGHPFRHERDLQRFMSALELAGWVQTSQEKAKA
jgi:TolB-like protein/Flp pilus assembly protein TadD